MWTKCGLADRVSQEVEYILGLGSEYGGCCWPPLRPLPPTAAGPFVGDVFLAKNYLSHLGRIWVERAEARRARIEKLRRKGVTTKRKLSIGPGANNPVGLVWIDLTDPTYGIHKGDPC